MSLKNDIVRISKLASVYIVGSVIPLLLSVFLLPIYTRYLTPDQMGITALCRQLVAPFSIVFNMGLTHAMLSSYYKTEANLRASLTKTVFVALTVQSLVFSVLLLVFTPVLAKALLPNVPLEPRLINMLWLMVVVTSFATAFIEFGRNISQINEKPFRFVSVNLCLFFLGTGSGLFVVVWLGWQGFGKQFTVMISSFLAAILAVFLAMKYQKGSFSFQLYRKLTKLGFKFIPHSFAGMLATSLNLWLLAKLGSIEMLGIYGIANFFANLARMPLAAFNHSAYPTLARLMVDGSEPARLQQSRIYTIFLSCMFGFVLSLSAMGTVGIRILADAAYHDATKVLPIIMFAWLLQFLYWACSNPVYHFGGGLWMAAATLSSLIVGVIANLILVPRYGMYGAAMAVTVCFFCRWLVIMPISKRMYKLPWERKKLATAFVIVLGCGVFDYFVVNKLQMAVQIPVKMVLIASYFGMIVLFGVIDYRYTKEVFNQLKNRFLNN